MTDFELAAINAFKQQFPGVKSKGCIFHYGQALLKNFVKYPGLKANNANPKVNSWFRHLCALSPLDQVDSEWDSDLNER